MFDLEDFLAPLDPSTLLMAMVVGIFIGVAMHLASHRMTVVHAYWMLAGGLVFFVPLSLARFLQGSLVWERFLATYILWMLFVLGISIEEPVRRAISSLGRRPSIRVRRRRRTSPGSGQRPDEVTGPDQHR